MVGAGSITSAVSTYLFLIIAGRNLGVAAYGTFSAFWGAFFLLAGLIGAIDLEASRQSAHNKDGTPRVQQSLLWAALVLGLASSVAWLLIAEISLNSGSEITFAGLVGIWLVIPLGLTRGSLIGGGFARSYGLIIAGEGLLRLIFVLLILLAGINSIAIYALITVFGLSIWIPWAKNLFPIKMEVSKDESLRNLGSLIFASAGSALLLSGLPWIISLNKSVTDSQVGILMTSVTLARVPILAFSVVQALLIPYFVRRLSEPQPANQKWNRNYSALALLAIASVVFAIFVGPPIIQAIFGNDFVADGTQLGILVASSWLLVVHMTLVSRLIAHNKHRYAAYSWLAGALFGSVLIVQFASTMVEISLAILMSSLACVAGSAFLNSRISSRFQEG